MIGGATLCRGGGSKEPPDSRYRRGMCALQRRAGSARLPLPNYHGVEAQSEYDYSPTKLLPRQRNQPRVSLLLQPRVLSADALLLATQRGQPILQLA